MSPLRRHHRPAVLLAPLGIILLVLCVASAPATAAPRAPISMADAFLVDETGDWFCPSGKVDCDGRSQAFAASLLEPGHLKASGRPLYLRAAKARNDCRKNNEQCANLGVPRAGPCASATSTPFCALKSLDAAKVRLGIVISAKRDAPLHGDPDDADDSDGATPRSPATLAWHACEVRKADSHHLFDFMFLDFTFRMDVADVRKAVGLIQHGKIMRGGRPVDCSAGRWSHVITNDTTWQRAGEHHYSLRTGAWAHAKRLGVIEAAAAVTSVAGGLTANDRAFVKRVNLAGSRPVLRLEVTPDTSEFAQLDTGLQCSLLRTWAVAQGTLDFTLLFPLFVHGVTREATVPYNSIVRQTFALQMALIADPSSGGNGCQTTPAQTLLATTAPAQPPAPAPAPAPPPIAVMPDVLSHEPINVTCHGARLNGWVNPHGSPTQFHFVYWKRGDPAAALQTGDGDAGAGTSRVEIARVVDGLVRNTGYTGRLVAWNAGGRALSDIFSFTTPGC